MFASISAPGTSVQIYAKIIKCCSAMKYDTSKEFFTVGEEKENYKGGGGGSPLHPFFQLVQFEPVTRYEPFDFEESVFES